MSLFQGLVLLQFNDADKLLLSDIKAATGIGESMDEAWSICHSNSCGVIIAWVGRTYLYLSGKF